MLDDRLRRLVRRVGKRDTDPASDHADGNRGGATAFRGGQHPCHPGVDPENAKVHVRKIELLGERPRQLILEDHSLPDEDSTEQFSARPGLDECLGELFGLDETLAHQEISEPRPLAEEATDRRGRCLHLGTPSQCHPFGHRQETRRCTPLHWGKAAAVDGRYAIHSIEGCWRRENSEQ